MNRADAQVPVALGVQLYPGVSVNAEVGSVHTIQYTTSLNGSPLWQCLEILQLTNKPHLYIDTTVSASTERYYRSISGPQDLAWIPPGSFLIGSPTIESGRGANEGPQTLVTFTRGFFMGKREVTQASYLALMSTNPSSFTGDLTLPVEMVSWPNAVAYCFQLTQAEQTTGRLPPGWVYRLPTEAEWEYACRAGTMSRFSYGDDADYSVLPGYAWFGDATTGKSHPVGTRLPNPWGLYDMHGNVWELCLDTMSYSGGRVTDPPPSGTAPMSRGGSWHSSGARCRSAARNPYDTTNREAWVGFRVVLTRN